MSLDGQCCSFAKTIHISHTTDDGMSFKSFVIFSVCVYEKIPLVQRPSPGIVSVNLWKQNKKTPKPSTFVTLP